MILSNQTLRKLLEIARNAGHPVIEPEQPYAIQPASIDVHINPNDIKMWKPDKIMYSHEPEENKGNWIQVPTYTVKGRLCVPFNPNRLYLISSLEYLRIPANIVAFLHGVSTMARMGFVPHQEAGVLDPGWEGVITGEASVTVPMELTLEWPDNPEFRKPRMGQVVFHWLDTEASPSYRGRYQGDKQAEPAKPHATTDLHTHHV